jgi:hypothetical protein
MNARSRKLWLLGTLTILAGSFGCTTREGRIGESRTESKTVRLGGAKSVRAELKMAAGELKISGGASDLMNATFAYNVDEWKPTVEYNVSGSEGQLTIEESGTSHTTISTSHNSWDLRLNNSVPMDLTVEMGAGQSDLNLSGLSLTNFTFQVGAGNATVDLTGDWKHDLSVQISGGVGQATVRLPQDVGVRANVQGGIGTVSAPGFKKDGGAYVNDAYGKSPVTIQLDVQGGIGQVNLVLAGSPPIV